MFPDLNIAKNYCQGRGKVKYVMQFVISLYIKELVQSDLQGQPSTLHFDEKTNSQVKKQYDGYATYFSLKQWNIFYILWISEHWKMHRWYVGPLSRIYEKSSLKP